MVTERTLVNTANSPPSDGETGAYREARTSVAAAVVTKGGRDECTIVVQGDCAAQRSTSYYGISNAHSR